MRYEINRDLPILIISISDGDVQLKNSYEEIKEERILNDYHFIDSYTIEDALVTLRKESGIRCVIIDDNDFPGQEGCSKQIQDIIRVIRKKNYSIPIFLSSRTPILGRLPMAIIREIHEYININQDTPTFIAGRLHLAIRQYTENLLPPYFSALKSYATDSPYYWDCPGHQGGVAYLKHPVGREFINFFGENIMRADIGIATPEMGDWLEHKGAPGASEKRAAALFGADKTYYVTGGSSQSNQIVGHSLPLKEKVVLVDRNCHKSVNHELTITQANPVYFQPSRNGFGLIGPIPPEQFEAQSISQKINDSVFASQMEDPLPVYAIITNCTYDGLIYDVTAITRTLSDSVPRIKFDEAWYAYAKFHPLYRGRFAMDVPTDKEKGPTLYAVQSTHKMLAAFSSASMIHIRNSRRAPVNYENFNQSFMMHGTTSPFYPIIASIDVATAMMEGEAGKTLLDEAINDALNFRKTMVNVADKEKEDNPDGWFFGVWQPTMLLQEGKPVSFTSIPNSILARDASCWVLREGECWHGFNGLPDGYAMLDPIKVTITCPGLNAQGKISTFGIPAPVVSKYLGTQRIIPARNGDYNILILFALGSTQGKWNTLIDLLMVFKRHYDDNTQLSSVLPDVAASASRYQNMGLGDLCRAIHQANIELDIARLSELACTAETIPVLSPSQAYEHLVADNTELVAVAKIRNRTLAVMITPYPPGIPLIMPGEIITSESQPIVDYLVALQIFGQQFPGFEHELQGVEIDEKGGYWVRCIKEDALRRVPLAFEALPAPQSS
nr:Orn/Lys/Arg decarboxylase N-terminal domain-containing protein [Pantoea sp. 201603H]